MRRGFSRRLRAALAGSTLAGALLGAPTACRADAAPCTIRWAGADDDGAWARALREARARVTAATSADCASVEIVRGGTGAARLTFTTRDGRSATRSLDAADDLVPVLDALLVTGLVPAPTSASPSATAPTVREQTTTTSRTSPESPAEAPPAPGPHLVLGASAGSRMGLSGGFLAPTIELAAAVALGRWEIGVLGQWEAAFAHLGGGTPAGFRMSSFEAGALAGRREPIGAAQLRYGLALCVASVLEEADVTTASAVAPAMTAFEPRLGVYAGAVWPRDAHLRAKLGLAGDYVVSRLHADASRDSGLPALPRWGLVLSLGVEGQVL